jgi:hypothetical protein
MRGSALLPEERRGRGLRRRAVTQRAREDGGSTAALPAHDVALLVLDHEGSVRAGGGSGGAGGGGAGTLGLDRMGVLWASP